MTHRIVIIDSQTPPPVGAAATTPTPAEPEYRVHVEFHPGDSLTSSQIGNEVARVQRLVNKIIEGTPD